MPLTASQLAMFVWGFVLVSMALVTRGQEAQVGVVQHNYNNNVESADYGLNDTDLLLAFVIFRHGDRTPDQEELDLYPAENLSKDLFFPYGFKALTNKGKQRGYRVGQYLRDRYDGLVSRLYLPDEVQVRTTDYARAKMTALTALAALYSPPQPQKWNPALDWQPVPYDTLPFGVDDLLYWYNCPRYLYLRDQIYELPNIQERIQQHRDLFTLLSSKTGINITKPEDVFFLDNLFQTLENVGISPPQWAQEIMPEIQEVTKLEYECEFFTDEMIRLATGVLMSEIVDATTAALSGKYDQPKLRLYSGHENNVAALMAAVRVFVPHQPKYGATFSLEFRRHRKSGRYGWAAVYALGIEEPAQILPVAGCGGRQFCDHDSFLSLTQDTLWSKKEYFEQCPNLQ